MKKTVSVYVARCNPKPAWGGRGAHVLAEAATQLECDPVARIVQTALTDMNAGEIRAVISIKIGDRKMARRLHRATRRGTHSPRKRKPHPEYYKVPQAYSPNNTIQTPP